MWTAVVACDKAYDGRFFYAVKTVGVYCRPSCKSRTPLQKNVCFLETALHAEQAGFRPCKRCRPDLPDYAPMAELARRAKALIDAHGHDAVRLRAELRRLGVSPGRLAAVFKQQYGAPPAQYRNQRRATRARDMLSGTDMSILDIAAETGFSGLPAFYDFFKRHTGTTPRQYRAEHKKGRECNEHLAL